jgi:MinD-like ATPase involved in chromosome partitioning or flagellar assembly
MLGKMDVDCSGENNKVARVVYIKLNFSFNIINRLDGKIKLYDVWDNLIGQMEVNKVSRLAKIQLFKNKIEDMYFIKNKRKYNLSAYQIKHKLEQREDDEQDEREYEQHEREYEQQFNSNNG